MFGYILSTFTFAILLNGHPATARDELPTELILEDPIPEQDHTTIWYKALMINPFEYTLPTGENRKYYPSCSGAPVSNGRGVLSKYDTTYSFFFLPGKSEKLVIYLEGGGMCFDAESCINSSLENRPTYNTHVDIERFKTTVQNGIFDEHEEGNPFNGYSKIYVPYCTGDTFIGSSDTTYNLEMSTGIFSWPIHHRGMDNFLSPLYWMKNFGKDYGFDLSKYEDVTIIGSDAGGAGVPFITPYLTELVPRAKINMIVDGAVPVLTETFYRLTIFDPTDEDAGSVWGFKNNMATWAGFDEDFFTKFAYEISVEDFSLRYYLQLSTYYSHSLKTSIVTSNNDLEQIMYFGMILALDDLSYPDDVLGKVWFIKANDVLKNLVFLPFHRNHMEDGEYHNAMISRVFFESGENSDTPSLVKWTDCMLRDDQTCWMNVEILPDYFD